MSRVVREIELLSIRDWKTLFITMMMTFIGLILLGWIVSAMIYAVETRFIGEILLPSALLIFLIIPLHEFLHYAYSRVKKVPAELSFQKFCPAVKFREGYTLKKNEYLVEVILPFIITSILFIAVYQFNFYIGAVTLILNYLSCVGDLTVLIRVLPQSSSVLINDQGSKFIIWEPGSPRAENCRVH